MSDLTKAIERIDGAHALTPQGDTETALAEGAAAYVDEDLTIAEQTFRLGSEDLITPPGATEDDTFE